MCALRRGWGFLGSGNLKDARDLPRSGVSRAGIVWFTAAISLMHLACMARLETRKVCRGGIMTAVSTVYGARVCTVHMTVRCYTQMQRVGHITTACLAVWMNARGLLEYCSQACPARSNHARHPLVGCVRYLTIPAYELDVFCRANCGVKLEKQAGQAVLIGRTSTAAPRVLMM